MKTFKNGEVWKKGFEANDIAGAGGGAMNWVEFKGWPPASMTAGAMSAVRSARSPIRW